ncbi:MAG: alpha/beta hydrolase [Chloroflexi bacterium]|nr:alpha/beta hydrolase [Chloroflexota bacterium]
MTATARTTVRTPDGRSLDVWLEGPADAVPLVFHLGTPGCRLPFEPNVRAVIDRGLRWVSYSRPGYGGSTRDPGRSVANAAADTAAVLDAIGADAAYVAGWSGGGPHALACAALMPDRVLGTATIAGVAPYPAEGLDWLAGMGAENVEEFQRAIDSPESLAEFAERDWPTFRDVTPEAVATSFGDLVDDVDRATASGPFAVYLAALFHEGLRDTYLGWLDDDLAFVKPWGFDLAALPGPVHVWQGAHDRMVPFAHGQWLAANVGGGCAHLHAEQGHLSLIVGAFPAIVDSLIRGT